MSSRFAGALADQFPIAPIVNLLGLAGATDLEMCAYAREHDFAVVSKDDDFRSLALVNGAPPKVMWLRIGDASTARIEAFIRSALVKIRTFEISVEESLLVLSQGVALKYAGRWMCSWSKLAPKVALGACRLRSWNWRTVASNGQFNGLVA